MPFEIETREIVTPRNYRLEAGATVELIGFGEGEDERLFLKMHQVGLFAFKPEMGETQVLPFTGSLPSLPDGHRYIKTQLKAEISFSYQTGDVIEQFTDNQGGFYITAPVDRLPTPPDAAQPPIPATA